MLKFPDDTQVGVIGLDDIMAGLYAEGRKPTEEAALEIIGRLEAKNNYIPPSKRVRNEYAYVLLKEYGAYLKARSGSSR
jgi:hypothetical protein